MKSVVSYILRLSAGCAVMVFGTVTLAGGQFRVVRDEALETAADSLSHETMYFEVKRIDAGTIDEQQTSSYVFGWENRGSDPIVVTRVQTSCSCLVAEYEKRPVPPDGSGTITVTYDPRGRPGSFDRRIYVYTQLSTNQPATVLHLTGRVEATGIDEFMYPEEMGTVRLKSKTLRFKGERLQTERIECVNTGKNPIKLSASADLLPDGVTFTTEPDIIGPGETADIVVSFDPAKTTGPLPQTLALVIDGPAVPPSQRTVRLRFGE